LENSEGKPSYLELNKKEIREFEGLIKTQDLIKSKNSILNYI